MSSEIYKKDVILLQATLTHLMKLMVDLAVAQGILEI
jgi:hypothetical protein